MSSSAVLVYACLELNDIIEIDSRMVSTTGLLTFGPVGIEKYRC